MVGKHWKLLLTLSPLWQLHGTPGNISWTFSSSSLEYQVDPVVPLGK